MTTAEKLLVQIFERKKWIIEQVKQHTELYNQHLSSKLLVDGITPPSWLLSPNYSSDPKELNKEELISRLLHPYTQPSVRSSTAHYHLYDNPAVTVDNGEFADGFFMETLASNKVLNGQDDPTVLSMSSEDHAGCALYTASELDVSITSPGAQTNERFLNIHNAPDHSLARIQRSKSRQKALEVRSSGKVLANSCSISENIRDVFSSRTRLSPFVATEQAGQKDKLLNLAGRCVIAESCEDWDMGESDCQSKDKGMNVCTDRASRFGSYAKVPEFAGGSMELGCLADNCREDVSSSGAKVGKRRSTSVFDSEHDGNIKKLRKSAGPSTACFQGCGGKKLYGEDCEGKDMESHVCNGRITRSRFSSQHRSSASDSSKADGSSYDSQRIDNAGMESGGDLPADLVDGSHVRVNPSDVLDKGCGSQQAISEDCKSQKEIGEIVSYDRMTRSWSSIQHNACVVETPDQDLPSHSVKADSGILSPLIGRLVLHANVQCEKLGLLKPSFGMVHQVTSSPTWANDQEIFHSAHCHEIPNSVVKMSRSDPTKRPAANGKLMNASGGHIITPCCESCCTVDEKGEADFVAGTDLVLNDLVDQSFSSNSNHAKPRKELECLVARTPSNPLMVESKHLNVNILEENNLKTSTSSSARKRLDSLLEKMGSSFSDPAASLDKGISGGTNQLHTGEESPEKSDTLSKGEKFWKDSFYFDIQENIDTWTEKYVPIVSEHKMSKSSQDKTEAGLNCGNSDIQDEADIMLSKMFGTSDLHILPVKLQLEEGHDPLQGQHSEEGDLGGSSKVKDSLVSTASGSKTCRPSYSLELTIKLSGDSHDFFVGEVERANPTCIFHDKIKQVAVQEPHALLCLEGEVSNQLEDLPLGENILATSSKDGSPLVEYLSLDRKFKFSSIESQQTYSRATPPNFRMTKLHSIQRGPASRYLKDIEVDVDTVSMYASEVSNSSDIELHQRMDFNLTEGLQFTYESQNGEVQSCFKEQNEQISSSTVISNEQLGVAPKDSGRFIEGMRTLNSSSNIFYESDHDDTQCCQSCPLDNKIDNVNFENLSLTNRILQATKPSESQYSVRYPSNKDLVLIYVDQSMPLIEGFVDALSSQSDSGEMDFSADQIGFEKLNLPRNMIDRASILAKLCRSASMETSPSDISSTSEFGGTQNIFHSVTNGLLESLDLNSTLPVNADVNKQLGFGKSPVNDVKDSFGKTPYSDCLTYSGARYGWDLRNQQASPVGKLWERLSSHTGSSEKLLSSNPDLMCFPIEEDSCISEENKDEIADDVQEEINWLHANHSDKRQPLKDLTNLGVNHPPTSVSMRQDIVRAGSYDFVSTESVLTATQDKAQQSTQKQYRNCNQTREKQTSSIANRDVRENKSLSIGANGIKKPKELSDNSTDKPNFPSKYSLKGQEEKLSLKETRRNNIVSNVNSFIPLVQQKQAAPICAGKRDVKVKALQAAEAAKRLEEKRENERKIKKEALKLEQAKLNEKNLRQMELGKKRKEEERKKKDANIIAKKRLREEEERKEKEKKRMRLEATRWQREQEEKMRAEKAELEKQRAKDEQIFRKKEFNESKNQQNREIGRADDDALTKIEAKLTHTGVAMNHEECSTSGDSFEAVKAMHTMDKSPTNKDLIVQKSQGSSYEISPYQCSDDEDEEYDKLPTKKYIPSWASKSFVALLLPLQQRRDPDVMFPLESCCSMDEVLLPRKLQQK